MLRRPCTAITLTVGDIAEYEKRRAQNARAVEAEAASKLTQESALESKSQSTASQSWTSAAIQQHSFATPQAQLHGQRGNHDPVDESMTVDSTDEDDATAAPQRPHPQASVFTPPNAPMREPPEQRRQRTRAERIGFGA